MIKKQFDEVFDNDILPFIEEIQANNRLVRTKDLADCKDKIFNEYAMLRNRLKDKIFGDKSDVNVLDRHKVAACMCAAFLKVSVFYKNEIVDLIRRQQEPIEAYFFYVNEMVAFQAGCVFLSVFMTNEHKDDPRRAEKIISEFPKLPPMKKSTVSFYENIMFNLSQIKTEQIGLEHFDTYIYSMFFFMLETYFYTQVA